MAGLRPPEADIGVAHIRIGATLALLGVFALLLLAFALLDRLGLETVDAPWGTCIAALVLFALTALLSRGRRSAEYYAADRELIPIAGGLAAPASLAGCFVIVLIGGAAMGSEAIVIWAFGAALGLAFQAFVIAPGLRRFGGCTPGDFLAARFGLRTRLATAAAAFSASLLLLIAALKTAAALLASIFAISTGHAAALAAAVVAAAILPGGFRSLTATQIMQYFVIVAAALAPAGYLAAQAGAAGAAGGDLGALLDQLVSPFAGGSTAATLPILLVAAGLASFTPMLAHPVAAQSGSDAKATMLWAVALAIVAIAGGILFGQALADAVGSAGSAQLLADPIAATLSLAALPAVLSGLLTAGAVAALLAAAQASLFSAAGILSHDLWDEVLDRKGPTGRRIFVARFVVIALAVAAVWLAERTSLEAAALLGWALALAAAGVFAPLVLGLWWRRCNGTGASLGAIAGFVVAGWGFLHAVGLVPWADPGESAMGAASAAAIGLAAGLVATIGVSLMTPVPAAEVQALVADIHSPRRRSTWRERPA